MLLNIFKSILNVSLSATVIAVVLLIVKYLIGKRLPAQWHYAVWVLLFLKFVMPFTLPSSLSIYNMFTPIRNISNEKLIQTTVNPDLQKTDNIVSSKDSYQNKSNSQQINIPIEQNNTNNNINEKSKYNEINWWQLCAYIWLIGMSVFWVYVTVSCYYINSNIKNNLIKSNTFKDMIYMNMCNEKFSKRFKIEYVDCFNSPFVIGIYKPKIIVPVNILNSLDNESLNGIISHEIMHIKWKDNLIRLIMIIILSVNWFNPVLWICFDKIAKDCEAACDARVIREFSDEMRKNYASTLLKMAQIKKDKVLFNAMTAFGESNLKKRVINIMKYKKLSFLTIAAAVVVLLILSITMLTGAKINKMILSEKFSNVSNITLSYVSDNTNKDIIIRSFDTKNNSDFCAEIYNAIFSNTKNVNFSAKKQISDYHIKIEYKNGNVDNIETAKNDNSIVRIINAKKQITGTNEEIKKLIEKIIEDNSRRPASNDELIYKKVQILLNDIMKNGAAYSSNPYDYIKDNKSFDELVALGHHAAEYMFRIYYDGSSEMNISKSDELKEYIMASACAKIMNIYDSKNGIGVSSGDEWFKKYGGNYQKENTFKIEDDDADLFPVKINTNKIKIPDNINRKNMDDVISYYLLAKNRVDVYCGEKFIEAHKIYRTEVKNGIINVYMRQSYGWYEFEDGCFTCCSGSDCPARMRLVKNSNGLYDVIECKEAEDGDGYESSIKDMFPKDIADMVLKNEGEGDPNIESIHNKKIQEYLNRIKKSDAPAPGNYSRKTFDDKSMSAIYNVKMMNEGFPSYDGTRDVLIKTGGPAPGSKVRCTLRTSVDNKGNGVYEVLLTRTWGVKINGKQPKSYWKFRVIKNDVKLIDSEDNDNLIIGIK